MLDISSETQHLNWEACYKELGFTHISEGSSGIPFEGFPVSVCAILGAVQPNLRDGGQWMPIALVFHSVDRTLEMYYLLQNEHPPRGLVRASLKRVEIDAARNHLAIFIPAIPIGSRVSGQIVPRCLGAQIQLPHQLTLEVVDAKCHRCICRQTIRQPCFRVKRIGEVLKERGALDLPPALRSSIQTA